MNTRRIADWARFLALLLLGVGLQTSNPVFGQSAERPEPWDWFAGDAHVHRGIGCGRSNEKEMLSPQQLLDMMKVNNLAVVSVLADAGNGEIKYADQDLAMISGQDNIASTPERIVHWDAEWHYDPQGVTFERKVIGGHLILLGLKQGGQPYADYTYPIFAWAKEHGGIGGFAHMQYLPFAFHPPPDGIPQSLDCCAPLEFPVETALGSASFVMEDVRGSDSALQAYYRLLNTGFRPGLAAGTDYSCNDNEPLGTLLTYVRIPDGKLTYEKWIDGIAHGRTVVSRNAHHEFLSLRVNDTAQPGDEVHLEGKGAVRVRIEWRSLQNGLGRIELVRNGAVVASQTAQASPGKPAVFKTTLSFHQSGWLAARRMDWQTGHRTHTGAIFVLVKGAPIRASAEDAWFFVRWIDNLLEQTSPGGAWSRYFTKDFAAAQKRYREARAIFLERAGEAEKQANQANKQNAP
ncbi:MAG: CehA/McbA family metallohydrolase [Acidobacteriia bacterium]|nr:CehA/McbA family metallohydrolase [Terriglobia bacterium]